MIYCVSFVCYVIESHAKGERSNNFPSSPFPHRYRSMTCIVDQLFPPVSERDVAIEFTDWNYWREPMLDLDDAMLQCLYSDHCIVPVVGNAALAVATP